jgi:hypothetical protein
MSTYFQSELLPALAASSGMSRQSLRCRMFLGFLLHGLHLQLRGTIDYSVLDL